MCERSSVRITGRAKTVPSHCLCEPISLRPGAKARSEADPLGMQAAPSSIPTSGTFFCGDSVTGHSPSSADSRRAVVSYWRKNVHSVLVNCLGGLPRNSVVRVTDIVVNSSRSRTRLSHFSRRIWEIHAKYTYFLRLQL